MRRYLRLFALYFAQYAQVRLVYKSDFFVSVITTLVASVFGLAVVYLLFQRAPIVEGWTFHEILFLYGYGMIPLSLFNVVSVNLYYFGQLYVIEGKFDRVLLRPVHSLFQVLSEQFRLEALSDTAVGLAIVVYCLGKLDMSFRLVDWAFLSAAALCGTVLYLAIFLLLTCVSFWVEDRVGVIPPVYNMLSFGRYPLNIYSSLIRFVLSWVIPFGFASFYPSTRLLGRMEYSAYHAMIPVMTVLFAAAAILLWNRGVSNYSSTGS